MDAGDTLQDLLYIAKSHKRMAAWHRKRSQEAMEKVQEVESRLAALGIRLEISENGDRGDHGSRSTTYRAG